ncbi:AMP-binding protein [Synechocystis sp. LKSZ1]|uniref:AMP-binding protein n=1 Tax=Synechocystis sp. LKSZ1 TaxID=3144951 RepID=UPI00336BCFA8
MERETLSALVTDLLAQGGLVGADPLAFQTRIDHYGQRLKAGQQVLLAEADPLNFLAGFLAARQAPVSLFLGNPAWQQQEWQALTSVLRPDVIFGNVPPLTWQGLIPNPSPSWIGIPTGGSSGRLRFACHTGQTLQAAVEAFQAYFSVNRVHSLCCLPLYHVSGLMQFLRSLLTGGQFYYLNYAQLKQGPPTGDFHGWFISLVPTQLQYLLSHHPHWLQPFQAVLLGGGPAWPSLLTAARQAQINLAPTYGMTETAAQIATLKPKAFAQGQEGVGRILPHAQVAIVDDQGQACEPGQVGSLQIQAQSLFHGYYPPRERPTVFNPGDLGYFDPQGQLHILGRQGRCLITGGEKVFPQEIEALLLSSGKVKDVVVLGWPDAHWGEQVIAVYSPGSATVTPTELRRYLKPLLSAHKCPKQWLAMPEIPRSPAGKLNYSVLQAWVAKQLAQA